MKSNLLSFVIFFWTIGITSQISFTESSASQNISVSHGVSSFIGGVSFFDFDGDGWDDVTFASEDGEPLYFYKNNSGTLTAVVLNLVDRQKDTRQVNWVDIDNDGDNDLFVVSNNASNRLYENDGNLNFTDITITSGISTSVMHSWGGSWGDYNNDGYLDLFLSNRDISNGLQPNILYKNNGNNTFTNVNIAAGISNSNHYSFCASFFDYNNDGWQDIYIANDRLATTNILYKNNGDGTFTDESVSSGTDIAIDAMSTTIDDYNNDGWLDIYVTNSPAGNYLLENNADGTFTNKALINGTSFDSVAWGAVFLDADNDMDQDLYVSGMRDGSDGSLPSAFYENIGSDTFEIPENAGFNIDTAESYSNAIGDINNDGYPDIVVVNKETIPNFVWMNDCDSNANNYWLKVTLEGDTTNKMGIGSWIEIQVNGAKQYRYTLCGEGYVSQNSGAEFFGLGSNTLVDYIKVVWLSGVEDILFNVSINQSVHIVESSTLSLNQNVAKTEFSIYPNPNNGHFSLQATNLSERFNIEIYTVHGQKVFTQNEVSNHQDIKLKKARGLYFIKIITSKGEFSKKLVIK